jgi:hypothetical protein
VLDYKPISLLNICLKLITKNLTNHLQETILELVHINQYGFLHSRNIQDCMGGRMNIFINANKVELKQ